MIIAGPYHWVALAQARIMRATAEYLTRMRPRTLLRPLDGLVFDTEGDHTIVLAIDGRESARLPFRVQTRPEPPPSEFRTGVYL